MAQHRIVGKLADVAGQYLHKGSMVYVEGKIRTRSYDDRNGVKRYVTEIHGDIMQMLDRRQDNSQTQQSQYQPAPNAYSGGSAQRNDNDDLPF